MIILGIDPGTRTVGYGLIRSQGSDLSYVDAGAIQLRASDPLPKRLAGAAAGLREILQQHEVDEAAVEDVFVRENPRTALKIGQGRGALLAVLGEAGIEVASYPPATVKRAVAGRGDAAKAQLGTMVARILGLSEPPEPDDVSDALAVALTHALRRNHPEGRPAR